MEKTIYIPNFYRTINNEGAILELLEQIYCESSLKEIIEKIFCSIKENKTHKAIQQYNKLLNYLGESTISQKLKNIMFDWKATPDGKGGYNVSPSSSSHGSYCFSMCCGCDFCDSCCDCCC